MDKPEHGEDINALPKRLKLVVSLDTQPPPAVLQLFDILHDVSLLSKSEMTQNLHIAKWSSEKTYRRN